MENGRTANQENLELNPLTKLHYMRSFMYATKEFIKDAKSGEYCMAALDMEHFRVVNKLYGRSVGDDILIFIAECLRSVQAQYGGVIGHFGGDNFCAIIPFQMDLVRSLWNDIADGVAQWDKLSSQFLPVIGVYPIEDTTVALELMYDRATMALSYAIGNYANHICLYDPSMENTLEQEWNLLADVRTALDNDEFTFFAQPQCDIFSGKIVGAESLVRWIHDGKVVPPGRFIPVLEKNGSVTPLDQVVWAKVIQWLHSWMERGYHPVPISINISRLDILTMDVPAYLLDLAAAYEVPAKYIKCEITESAYAEEGEKVNNTVKQLRDAGFLVMMDDFGSGYSSLNTLRSMPIDVLKIDMKFLELSAEEEQKGIGILESVVNMARLLGIPIIVEGVETQQHENLLQNMGCRYTQGYYYYRPMPIDKFEVLLADERRLDFGGLRCKQVEALHVREFLDGNLFTDTMLNNILGATAFYDMYENEIEITRVNEQYFQLSGFDMSDESDSNRKLWNHVWEDDRHLLFSLFERAYENRPGSAEGYIHYIRMDGKVLWVYMKIFFLREKDGHKIFYSALVDMSALRERKERRLLAQEVKDLPDQEQAQLDRYYGNIPCGFGLSKILVDETGQPADYDIIYINKEMQRLCGGDLHKLRHLILKAFKDDTSALMEKAYQAAMLGETLQHYAYSSVSGHYLQLTLYQYEYGYVACMMRDVTYMQIHEDALSSMVLAYREVYFVHLRDNYLRMIYPDPNQMMERGSYDAVINRHFSSGKILKYDEESARRFLNLDNLRTALETRDSVECRYRRSAKDTDEEWCLTSITVSERENGIPRTAVMTIRSIDAIIKEEEEHRQARLAESLANMSDGFFIYRAIEDERILYANPKVMEIFGCRDIKEFMEHVGGSFQGMVHPEDLDRVEWDIQTQIHESEGNMDYVQYRIIRKDEEIRWIDDCGHLEQSEWGEEHRLFYVFIKDISDVITTAQKNKVLDANRFFLQQRERASHPETDI